MTTAPTTTTETTTATYRPIVLPCPHCGEKAASLVFYLTTGHVGCQHCDEIVSRDDLHQMMEQAHRLIAFLDVVTTV